MLIETIIEEYENGMATIDIANRHGVTRKFVSGVLRKNNIKLDPCRRYDGYVVHNKLDIDINEIKKLHSLGLTNMEISRVLNCPYHYAEVKVRELGLKHNKKRLEVPSNFKSMVGEFAYNKLTDKEWLYDQYINENKSSREIAKELGCGKKAVMTAVKRHGIEPKSVNITFDEFIIRARSVHGDKYTYPDQEFDGVHSKVKIICKDHGEFWQDAGNHIYNGHTCPSCACVISNIQNDLYEYISSLYGGEVILNDRSTISPFEIDIYVPDLKLGFEVHGIYYHSYDHVESKKERYRHFDKCNMCVDRDIQLIQIFETELVDGIKSEVIKSKISYLLGLSGERIYARKCDLVKIDNNTYRKFMDKNHLQGYKHAEYKYGFGLW